MSRYPIDVCENKLHNSHCVYQTRTQAQRSHGVVEGRQMAGGQKNDFVFPFFSLARVRIPNQLNVMLERQCSAMYTAQGQTI